MTLLNKAIAVAIGSLGLAASADAATYIVTSNTNTFSKQLEHRVEAQGGTVTARLPQIGVAIVESDYADFDVRAARVPGVHTATRDIELQFDLPPAEGMTSHFGNPPNSGDDDALFDLQWGHAAIDAAGAWNAGYRGAGATVAVLDSGLFCQHVDLAPNVIGGTSFVAGESYCNAPGGSFHGTHVAGTILAADNGVGTIGVAPQARLLAVKVLSAVSGSGSFGGIIQGIVWAAENGADVINMSLGVRGGLPVNGPDANEVAALVNATARATRYAARSNTTVVVSAGNDARDLDKDSSTRICDANGADCFNLNLRAFPAELPGVLAVSALAPEGWAIDPTTNPDILASYSNYGVTGVSFSAPGGDARLPGEAPCTVAGLTRPCWVFDLVYSTARDVAGYAWAGGTSMAAPHVSGVAALIVGKAGGEMTPSAVEQILRQSADDLDKPGKDAVHGFGRVNAARAVAD